MAEANHGAMRTGPGGDVRPDPDPTERTIDSLRREIGALKEVLVGLIDGRFAVISTRLDGADKAVKLLQEATDKMPAEVNQAIRRLQELHEEKFASIQLQFQERDVRVEQSSTATKIAVDAALQAAKEAVGAQNVSSAQAIAKSEAATTKQIDAIGTLIAAQAKSSDEKNDDIKSRVQMIEGHTKGIGDSWGVIVGAVGIIVAIVTVASILLTRN